MDKTELIVARAEGRSLAQTAEAANASISSVQRELRKPEVQEQIRELQLERLRSKWGRRMELEDLALKAIEWFLKSGQPAERLKAAALTLGNVERHARLLGLVEEPGPNGAAVVLRANGPEEDESPEQDEEQPEAEEPEGVPRDQEAGDQDDWDGTWPDGWLGGWEGGYEGEWTTEWEFVIGGSWEGGFWHIVNWVELQRKWDIEAEEWARSLFEDPDQAAELARAEALLRESITERAGHVVETYSEVQQLLRRLGADENGSFWP